ncbi:MAG: type II and III secretion system protein family protein [Robiginitomaculum sp.]|nr:type II and III secretion system protein family protein [Robiginitomaculum sp.]
MKYLHQHLTGMTKFVLPIVILSIFMSVNFTANAKSWVEVSADTKSVSAQVLKDGNITLRSDEAFSEVRVANTKIADVVVLTNRAFHINGKARGKTSVMIYDSKKRLMDVINVEVNLDIQGLKKSLFEAFPKERIEVRRLAGKIYLSGDVSTSRIAEQASKIAGAYAGTEDDVTSGLVVRDSHQVMLEVRFVEATRSAIKELGVGLLIQQAGQFSVASGVGALGSSSALSAILQDSFGPTNVDVRIDALEEKGVIRTLAEPNLVSMSGETASFLAGGEFPIPVSGQNGQISITYRQFGVGLSFTPTVLDDGIINLKVSPEVSQLDPTNSVRVAGVEVPGLSIRRASTTVELRNSQSFAIAGLLQNTSTNRASQVPWLGDVPILGALFRSTRYQNNETELVIIVTPRLVQPVSDINQLATPLDGSTGPSEIDFFLGGRIDGPKAKNAKPTSPKTKASASLSARYGHVLN